MKFSMTFPWRRKPMGNTYYRTSSILLLCQMLCFIFTVMLAVPADASAKTTSKLRIVYLDDPKTCIEGKKIINLSYGEKSAVIVKLRQSDQKSFGNTECHLEFKASEKRYVSFTFQEMDLPCSSYTLKFIGDVDLVPDFVRDILGVKKGNLVCGNLESKKHSHQVVGASDRYVRYLKTTDKEVDFHFTAKKSTGPNDKLTLIATAYKEDTCSDYYHTCSEKVCIEEELRCDGYYNCANGSDEHPCTKPSGTDIYSTTVGIVAGIILVAVAALVIFWWCGRQAKHDSREQRSRLERQLTSGIPSAPERHSPRLPSYNTVLRQDRQRSGSPVPDNDEMPPPYCELFPDNESEMKQNQENLVIDISNH